MKYSFQTSNLPNIMKKSTTFINDMLLNFSTLPTLLYIRYPKKALECYAHKISRSYAVFENALEDIDTFSHENSAVARRRRM